MGVRIYPYPILVRNHFALLKRYFGFDGFRPLQEEIVLSLIGGKDTLALLPTGGGKSLCFQLPALALPGTTLVISPLISLMSDQVAGLKKKGITAHALTSQCSKEENQQITDELVSGQVKLLYLSPEKLASKKFQNLISSVSVSLVVLDEAHCLSQWGHEFRPPYLTIASNLSWLDRTKVSIAAFTATATDQVVKEIITVLDLNQPKVFRASFERTNLSLLIKLCENHQVKDRLLFSWLKKRVAQSGIIYTSTRKSAEEVSLLINYLFDQEICHPYHAGLTGEKRSQIQIDFIEDKIKLIAATNAFGMGVDKPNIRFVVHYQLPGSLEAYYQEVGRAGRDREFAECLMLAEFSDTNIQTGFINKTNSATVRQRQVRLFESMIDFIITSECRSKRLLAYFSELKHGYRCGQCDNCQPDLLAELCSSQAAIPTHLEEIFNQNQWQWFEALEPKSAKDFTKIPGIGRGWLDQWYNTGDVNDS